MGAEVPQNSGFMVAGYAVTAVIVLGYAVALVRRARAAMRAPAPHD